MKLPPLFCTMRSSWCTSSIQSGKVWCCPNVHVSCNHTRVLKFAYTWVLLLGEILLPRLSSAGWGRVNRECVFVLFLLLDHYSRSQFPTLLTTFRRTARKTLNRGPRGCGRGFISPLCPVCCVNASSVALFVTWN